MFRWRLRTFNDPKLLADFTAANSAVIAALKDYEKFLKTDLLPRSNGDFRLGAENFSKKLPTRRWWIFRSTACSRSATPICTRIRKASAKRPRKSIAPGRPAQILADLEKDHPAPDKLLDAFRDTVERLRDFIIANKIVTIPSPVLPILEETPPFERALTFASMDTPGPYENVAKEAFFNVTLPEKDWTPARVEDFMQQLSTAAPS